MPLVVDDDSPEAVLAEAGRLLERGAGEVVLAGVATIRASGDALECAVEPPFVLRCEEEGRVAIENAARAFAGSRLARFLPDRPLRWTLRDAP